MSAAEAVAKKKEATWCKEKGSNEDISDWFGSLFKELFISSTEAKNKEEAEDISGSFESGFMKLLLGLTIKVILSFFFGPAACAC